MLQEADNLKNLVVLIIQHIQCLPLMYSEVAWIQVSLGNHVKPLIILDPDYPPDYLSISCDYGLLVQNNYKTNQFKLL